MGLLMKHIFCHLIHRTEISSYRRRTKNIKNVKEGHKLSCCYILNVLKMSHEDYFCPVFHQSD